MSNGITPNDHNRLNAAHYNQQKKNNAQSDASANEAANTAPPTPRETVDADRIFDLLGKMGSQNLLNGQIENVSMDKAMDVFTDMISPEVHAKLYSTFEKSFKEEFGFQPSPFLVQEALDNYLIGTPDIQQ